MSLCLCMFVLSLFFLFRSLRVFKLVATIAYSLKNVPTAAIMGQSTQTPAMAVIQTQQAPTLKEALW